MATIFKVILFKSPAFRFLQKFSELTFNLYSNEIRNKKYRSPGLFCDKIMISPNVPYIQA